MPSAYDLAKRAFVSVLLLPARSHDLVLTVTRESPDPELTKAFRKQNQNNKT